MKGSCAILASSRSPASTADMERCSSWMLRKALSLASLIDVSSDKLRVGRAGLALAQVAVEYHAHDAYEQPPLGSDDDPFRAELDQAVALERFQVFQLLGKVLPEIHQVSELDRFDRQPEMA